jgi:hypothetical protein
VNNKQRQTLADVFEEPTRADVRWPSVRSLVEALGGSIKEAEGSRVRLQLTTVRMVIHVPHPGQILGRTTVRRLRAFLQEAGIGPEHEE